MNPESGSLMRAVAHSASISININIKFSAQRSVSGRKFINNNAAVQKIYYPGAATGVGNAPAIWF